MVDDPAFELALLLALTCRCAINLQMSLDWSDMTNGSMQDANGVAAASAECAPDPYHAGKREERHQQLVSCRVLQLLSRLDENLPGSRPGWLFHVSEMRGCGR